MIKIPKVDGSKLQNTVSLILSLLQKKEGLGITLHYELFFIVLFLLFTEWLMKYFGISDTLR